MVKLMLSRKDPPIGSALSSSVAGIEYQWGSETQLVLDDCVSLTTSQSISRHVARLNPALNLYPTHILHRTQVDHWLSVSSTISLGGSVKPIMKQLNAALAPSHCLVPPHVTVADYEVFAALYRSSDWQCISTSPLSQHVARWYNSILTQVSSILASLPQEVQNNCTAASAAASLASTSAAADSRSSSTSSLPATSDNTRGGSGNRGSNKGRSAGAPRSGKKEEGGKFVELPDAKMGEVVVRFPPEASGYLHIGHAKAALLNQYYQQAFKGKLIMRFDDTNPAKEDAHFEKVILEDLKMLQVVPDRFTHTSDYFDLMLQLCESLIKKGLAFVDDTDAETMKAERDERKNSKNRDNTVEKNLSMWEEMKKGSTTGQKCAVRAKIDMNSNNGCMRDPTIYRCKPEPHVRTGTKYKVYPTYDFACPIVDSIEGVTHALRTTEYHDRDEQFFWFLEKLELRKLHIYEYSRLNMNNTVLSKRKLTWFVEQGLVDGWDDPRFPTVRGILRHGMTVEGLRQFIVSQGSSRAVVNMEWDKIWSFNKKVIDAYAPRYSALPKTGLIPVNVSNVTEQATTAQKHPKDPAFGTKTVWIGPKVLIEAVDADLLKEGTNATFINWGNLMIKKINRANGNIVSVDAEPNLSDTNFKATVKLTWLPETDKAPFTPVVSVVFDHIITKGVLSKDEDFKNFICYDNRKETAMFGDHEMKNLKVNDIIQVMRKGFYRVDEEYKPASLSSCQESPVVLFYIPDGHTKDSAVPAEKSAMTDKEKSQSAKGKAAEKSPQEEAKPIVGTSKIFEIHEKILEQGGKIRQLKTDNADKNVVMSEVNVLKEMKANFLSVSGVNWTPNIDMSQFGDSVSTAAKPAASTGSSSGGASAIHQQILDQGSAVRNLKGSKADKAEVTAAVNVLLTLKKQFKDAFGIDWTPEIDISTTTGSAPAAAAPIATAVKTVAAAVPATGCGDPMTVHLKILDQGNVVRTLKTNKADKTAVTGAINVLLGLKKEFKNISGIDWTPNIDVSQFRPSVSSPAPVASPALTPQGSSLALVLHEKIIAQGSVVRNLKGRKADKADVTEAVNLLLSIKKEFKEATGIDWVPSIDIAHLCVKQSSPPPVVQCSGNKALGLHEQIVIQGSKVRTLKSDKADKAAVKEAVDLLLLFKQKFKDLTSINWKPDLDISQFQSKITAPAAAVKVAPAVAAAPSAVATAIPTAAAGDGGSAHILHSSIKTQGDKIRDMKGSGANKADIKVEVTKLLALKEDFKAATSVEWKPDVDMSQFCGGAASGGATVQAAIPAPNSAMFEELNAKVKDQGDKVRQLKSEGADKVAIKSEVDLLLKVKQEFKEALGVDWKPDLCAANLAGQARAPSQPRSGSKPKEMKKQPKKEEAKTDDSKKQTRLGLEVLKEDNLSDWYSQVITKSDMIEYYNVSGCYILRPWSYSIWDVIKNFVDGEIQKLGVENCYFPIFVSKDALEKEKTHIADFSPEVAWVTRSGNSELAEPIAIRPTSETVMYPAFAKWIQSHRDLPLRLNQWNNVVRWEFKQPTPFLRTREFLWQEGHTAFATKPEATEEVYQILDIYARVYEELLAIPVIKGKKTEKEKFAGGDFTTTTEAFVSASGRGIQGATSHHLGQNFAKMFEIIYEDPTTQEKKFVYQNSWGMTTRTIGVMVMIHGDNKGLVLPPNVASLQAVIMPVGITAKTSEDEKNALNDACKKLEEELIAGGVRTRADMRDNVTPAWKFNHWELKGVPLRLELGPREVASGQVFVVRRDNGDKQALPRASIAQGVTSLLSTIQSSMLARATEDLNSHQKLVTSWNDFVSTLENKMIILAPFCGEEDCEDTIKKESARDQDAEPGAPSMGAKSLCIPFKQPQALPAGSLCIHPKCGKPAQYYCLFGRSY